MKMAGWVRLTQCENIPLREGRAVQIDGHEIAVFNLGGRFLAMENRCPHRGGPLADGIVSGEMVVCPLHARKVCMKTGKIEAAGEPVPCAQTYPTRIADGHVDLNLTVWGGDVTAPQPATLSLQAVELAVL